MTIVAFILALILCGCKSTVLTQTETLQITATGPTITNTQTIASTQTITNTQTISSILTTTAPGPTITSTVTQTKSVAPTAGVIYVSNITPASPSTVTGTQQVTMTFDYIINNAAGARLYVTPLSNGLYAPCIFTSSLVVPKGGGQTSRYFFRSPSATGSFAVDQLHITMEDPTTQVILYETYITVNYTFVP
jgi:hypothetical protein